MATKKVPNLRAKHNKDGSTRWYWEPNRLLRPYGWRPQSLGTDEAAAYRKAEEINADVERWRRGQSLAVPVPAVLALPPKHTLAWLIHHYTHDFPGSPAWPNIKSDDGTSIKPASRSWYRTGFDRLARDLGEFSLDAITAGRVTTYKKKVLIPTIGRGPARQTLTALRVLYNYAGKEGFYDGPNPAENFGIGPRPPRKVVWDKHGGTQDMDAMKAGARAIGCPELCLAFELIELIGQREKDMIRMRCDQWREVPMLYLQLTDDEYDRLRHDDGPDAGLVMGFHFTQRKTGEPMAIPVAGQLRRDVEKAIARNRLLGIETVLWHERGGHKKEPRAWRDGNEIWRKMAEARKVAVANEEDPERKEHLARIHIHDLRRTAITRLAELGVSKFFIRAISGHSLKTIEKMLDDYVASGAAMAGKAIVARMIQKEKLAEREARKRLTDQRKPLALPAPDDFDDDDEELLEEAPEPARAPVVLAPEPIVPAAPDPASLADAIAIAVAAALRAHGIQPAPVVGAAATIEQAIEAHKASEAEKRSEQSRKAGLARAAKAKGEDKRPLSADQVLMIRRASPKTPLNLFASRFGVSDKTISAVRHNRTYRDVIDDGRELPDLAA